MHDQMAVHPAGSSRLCASCGYLANSPNLPCKEQSMLRHKDLPTFSSSVRSISLTAASLYLIGLWTLLADSVPL